MNLIITANTQAGLWQKLIHEAAQAHQLLLPEDLESYLVFLLMRYSKQSQLATSILGQEFLSSQQTFGKQRSLLLQEVADKCLLYAGLFPKRAERRRVKLSYYIALGCTAYALLAEQPSPSLSALYTQIKQNFIDLMDVLQTIRDYSAEMPSLLPLEAQALWQELGSRRALAILQSYSAVSRPKRVN